MFLLDTNVISDVRRRGRGDPGVAEWYANIPEADLFLSVLTIGEVRRGIEQSRQRGDNPQADVLESWLGTVRDKFMSRVLPVDEEVAETWGRISAIRPVPVEDALLAATAIVNDFTLVTRNTKHVQGLGARILNPFTG